MMCEWIPFFEALIWPATVVGFTVWRRVEVQKIFRAIAKRIEQGDEFHAGTSGVKLSASLGGQERHGAPESSIAPRDVYLIHSARRAMRLDKNGEEYYRIRVWVDADEIKTLDKISSVTYRLHSSFERPIRETTDRLSQFALETAAWGQFNLTAEITFKDDRPSLVVERYINF